jgi:hypothetical protein
MTGKEIAITACAVAVSLVTVGGAVAWLLSNYSITASESGLVVLKTQQEKTPCFVGMGYYLSGQVPECAKR